MLRTVVTVLSTLALFNPAASADCDPSGVRDCLVRFQHVYELCGPDDYECKCDTVATSGLSCFMTCTESAMQQFVATFDNGACSEIQGQIDYESLAIHGFQFVQKPAVHPVAEEKAKSPQNLYPTDLQFGATPVQLLTQSRANGMTSAPELPAALFGRGDVGFEIEDQGPPSLDLFGRGDLDVEEYHRSVLHSRMKENLRSIRSESAKSVSRAQAQLLNEQVHSSMAATTTTTAKPERSMSSKPRSSKSDLPTAIEATISASNASSSINSTAGSIRPKSRASTVRPPRWFQALVLGAATGLGIAFLGV